MKLANLFENYAHKPADAIVPLAQSGSNRRYFRITADGESCIGVEGISLDENRAFIALAEHFAEQGLPVPRVLAKSPDLMCYLQDDLGTVSLFDAITEGRTTGHFSEQEKALLRRTIALLPKLQFAGAERLDFNLCYPQPRFDERTVMFDLNYFKYCFLKPSGLEFDEMALQNDFERLQRALLSEDFSTFMHRDFQARNVMLKNGEEPYFIDFQTGRCGPIYYDVASFLWQAKANYPDELRRELIEVYLANLADYQQVDKAYFLERLRLFVLFRTLQVLGAYGFRGMVERKAHFLQSVPFAMDNLRSLLQQPFDECPYLCKILAELAAMPRWNERYAPAKGRLMVRIFSFSYKKGVPDDLSGNGGGYVFDCRAVHNPGRYAEYRNSTGMDADVIEFLERDGEILTFMQSVYALADAHVARYLERGFTDLMFSFGCTGGQHRSVYAAEHLASHLAEKFDIDIVVCHRERGITKKMGN